MKVFLTGGAGYIGSHICIELLKAHHQVLIYDNLSNSSFIAINRIKTITNCEIEFIKGDIRDPILINKSMERFLPDVVIHCGGLKAVGESVANPEKYYDVNVCGSIAIINAMKKSKCKNIIFSSSATVYGEAVYLPYDEIHPLKPTNPYGRTKLIVEQLLEDWVNSANNNRAVCLRYFNPVGAHSSGKIGEDPAGRPNNLMPYISQVAIGKLDCLSIFGDDYSTHDGTGGRDYIHVVDLAIGHLRAIERIFRLNRYQILNLGTGNVTTVKELISAFERASGKKVATKIKDRRPGDVAESWADPSLANSLLDIKFERTIDDMCNDAWRWQSENPDGYL